MMEAARTSETLVHFYQTTRRYNPENSHFRFGVFLQLNIQGSCLYSRWKQNGMALYRT
jgi:hypothetical protein